MWINNICILFNFSPWRWDEMKIQHTSCSADSHAGRRIQLDGHILNTVQSQDTTWFSGLWEFQHHFKWWSWSSYYWGSWQTPGSGETYITGSLRGRGIRVQQWRVQERLRIVGPVGRAFRGWRAIQWRVYNVSLPNQVWYVLFCRFHWHYSHYSLAAQWSKS